MVEQRLRTGNKKSETRIYPHEMHKISTIHNKFQAMSRKSKTNHPGIKTLFLAQLLQLIKIKLTLDTVLENHQEIFSTEILLLLYMPSLQQNGIIAKNNQHKAKYVSSTVPLCQQNPPSRF